jgi:hypothetical protein
MFFSPPVQTGSGSISPLGHFPQWRCAEGTLSYLWNAVDKRVKHKLAIQNMFLCKTWSFHGEWNTSESPRAISHVEVELLWKTTTIWVCLHNPYHVQVLGLTYTQYSQNIPGTQPVSKYSPWPWASRMVGSEKLAVCGSCLGISYACSCHVSYKKKFLEESLSRHNVKLSVGLQHFIYTAPRLKRRRLYRGFGYTAGIFSSPFHLK